VIVVSLVFLRDTIKDQVCNFTYNGVNFCDTTSIIKPSFSFDFQILSGYITPYSFVTTTTAATSATLTIELKITQDGQTISSGQIPMAITSSSRYFTKYEYKYSDNPGYALTMPWNDGRVITIHCIARADGVVQKDTTFQTVAPINLSVSSVSPTTLQTGKVCTVNLSMAVPYNSYWRMSEPFRVYGYYNRRSSSDYDFPYVATYTDNGITEIQENSYGFSSFYFYYPYQTLQKTSDVGNIKAKILAQTIDLYSTSSGISIGYKVEYTLLYSFTWSYINQTDSNASPTISNASITESPSGLLAQYGKYIGGGIQTLTFDWSITYRYGASFDSLTYSLYSSNGTLINSWNYNSVQQLQLLLENETDVSQYVVVTVTCNNGVSASYQYSTYNVYGYSNPQIISLNVSRCNQDGSANDEGAYCKISYQFKVVSLNNQNSKEVTLSAPDGSHVYTNLDYNHGSPYVYISAADIEHSYAITVTVEDDFVSVSATRNVSTAGVIMDFLYDGKGIGLGKVAETSEMVEVNPQWVFKCETMTFKGIDLQSILESLGYVFPT